MFPARALLDAYAQLKLTESEPSLKVVRDSTEHPCIQIAGEGKAFFIQGLQLHPRMEATPDLPLKWLYIVMRQGCDFMVLREHQGRISLDVTSDIAFLQSKEPRTSLDTTARSSVIENANAQGIILH
jgi:hypothetical protein